jgi:hypothetical protein
VYREIDLAECGINQKGFLKGIVQREMDFGLIQPISYRKQGYKEKKIHVGTLLTEMCSVCVSWRIKRIRQPRCVFSMYA